MTEDYSGTPNGASESDPAARLVRFVKDHPVAAIAGAVAAGAVVSAFLPRRAGSKLAGRAAQIIEIASVAGLALGRNAMERAENAGTGLRRQSEVLTDKAGALGSSAAERASRLGGAAAERIADTAAGLRRRIGR